MKRTRQPQSTIIVPLVIASLLGFSTLRAQTTANLLTNPGAELGTGTDPGMVTNWAPGGTSNPGRDDGSFDPGINPQTGLFDFYGGRGANGTLDQTVSLLTAGLTPAQLVGATATFHFFEQSLNQGALMTPLEFC